jgi:outer membrane biosynthesis protein TonB
MAEGIRDNSCNSCRAPVRFWRNVVLIALAHVALIAGLIRWSLAARASSNPESIVWLGGAEDLATGESDKQESPAPKPSIPAAESSPLRNDEVEEEKPVAATVPQSRDEIELPSPTPKPRPSPKPTASSTPKPKPTPKPVPRPTPKKVLVAKASAKPSVKEKPSPAKASQKSEKSEKKALAKNGPASQADSGKTRSGGLQSAVSGGGSNASEFGWYGNMLHDRFYSAWIQPTTNVPSGAKISTLVKVRIEKDGRVSKFEIIKPSENVIVNGSVAAIARQVTEVDPPPAGLIKGDHYDVKINFELNTEQESDAQKPD